MPKTFSSNRDYRLISPVLILLFTLITTISQAQTDTTFYSTKEPTSFRDVDYLFEPEYYELDNGDKLRNGKVEWFYLDHRPFGYGTYKDDELNGPYVILYRNGNIKESGLFSEGEAVGLRKRRYSNGQMRSVEIMNNQEMNLATPRLTNAWDSLGNSIVSKGHGAYDLPFFDDPEYLEKGEYQNGLKTGFWRTFKNGILEYEEVYDTLGNLENGISYDSSANTYYYQTAEVDAEFEGGNDGWISFLTRKLKYPKEARKLEIEGNVYVSFHVNTLGEVINAEIVRGIGFGCDKEALRVINLSSGRWTSPKLRGKKSIQRLVLRVVYKLE